MDAKEFVAHHGVKGMRWGVRKNRGGSKGSVASAPSRPKAHELSDVEIKKAIERMNLEQQYSNLAGHSKAKPKDAKGEVASFIAEMGKSLVKQAVSTAGTQAINAALKK